MSNDNKIFEDFTKLAGSMMDTAVGSMTDVKQQFDEMFKQRFEIMLNSMELVSREEFEVTKDMVSKLRIQVDELEQKIAELEKK